METSNESLNVSHSGLRRLERLYRRNRGVTLVLLVVVAILSIWLQWWNTNKLMRTTTVRTNGKHMDTEEDEDNISSPWYRQRKNVKVPFGSTAQFIFTVGLEGTGHHWMQTLIARSPATQSLKNAGVWPDMQTTLQTHLFQHYIAGHQNHKSTGLFNAHCSRQKSTPGLHFRGVVSVFQSIEEAVKASPGINHTIPFAINPIPVTKKHGMLSYPNYPGSCKSSNYPDLTMLFQACNMAKVDCFLVYIHRNPVDVLHSNIIKREFLPSLYEASQLYSTMLHAISSQIRNFQDRVLGCLDFFAVGEDSFHAWYNAQLDLWDWRLVPDQYESMVKTKYRTPERNDTLYHDHVEQLSRGPAATYLKSLFSQHYETLELCQGVIKKPVVGD